MSHTDEKHSSEEMHLEDGGPHDVHNKETDSFKDGDDEALKVLGHAQNATPITSEEQALVRRKIDRWLMP